MWLRFEYLFILTLVFFATLAAKKYFKIILFANRKQAIITTTFLFVVGVLWDSYAIARGHWVYPADKNIRVMIGLMPLEDYLFMLVIPFLVLTSYKILSSKN